MYFPGYLAKVHALDSLPVVCILSTAADFARKFIISKISSIPRNPWISTDIFPK